MYKVELYYYVRNNDFEIVGFFPRTTVEYVSGPIMCRLCVLFTSEYVFRNRFV